MPLAGPLGEAGRGDVRGSQGGAMTGRRDSGRVDMGEGIRQALGKHVKILHKVAMKLEKGGDRTDNRVLVFTPHRLFVMTAKVLNLL